jgi:hypothetical protein
MKHLFTYSFALILGIAANNANAQCLEIIVDARYSGDTDPPIR